MKDLFSVLPEVADALAEARPVVALESTIIAHGLPHPRNLEVAQALEQAVRDHGAVPATIAVLDGKPNIGLDEASLAMVADKEAGFAKASTRDLAVLRLKGARDLPALTRDTLTFPAAFPANSTLPKGFPRASSRAWVWVS